MTGAAQKTPFDEDPLVENSRRSRRMKGENPSILDGVPESAALKKLLTGGRGGRSCSADEVPWQLPSATPGPKITPEQSTTAEKDKEQQEERLRLIDLNELENAINSMSCSCKSHEDIDSFSQYCIDNNSNLSAEKMQSLKQGWLDSNKQKKENNNIALLDNSLGFATSVTVWCRNCNSTKEMKAKQAKKYAGKNYNGTFTKKHNCAWYETNIKLVLATIASGIGPTDMERFLTFLGLPIPMSFAAETFSKIENLLGDSLIRVAKESMKESL